MTEHNPLRDFLILFFSRNFKIQPRPLQYRRSCPWIFSGTKSTTFMKTPLATKTGAPPHAVVSITKARENQPPPSVEERMAAGKALRERVPRSSHANWSPAPDPPA